jgi:hypothetical protein
MPDTDAYEFVALQQIDHNGVRAYNPGDLVPAANVEAHGYTSEQVAKRSSKAAKQVTQPQTAPGAADKATS